MSLSERLNLQKRIYKLEISQIQGGNRAKFCRAFKIIQERSFNILSTPFFDIQKPIFSMGVSVIPYMFSASLSTVLLCMEIITLISFQHRHYRDPLARKATAFYLDLFANFKILSPTHLHGKQGHGFRKNRLKNLFPLNAYFYLISHLNHV